MSCQCLSMLRSVSCSSTLSRVAYCQDYLLYAEGVAEYDNWYKMFGEAMTLWAHVDVPGEFEA